MVLAGSEVVLHECGVEQPEMIRIATLVDKH